MFRFKQFVIHQEQCAMKVGTDGVLIGAWAQVPTSDEKSTEQGCGTENPTTLRILDVGTGTGIIALMMAQRFPHAQIAAIDIDKDAVQQATFNVQQSPFAKRITVLHELVQFHQGSYDAVVCNPPYFENAMKAPDHQRMIARHADMLTYTELMQNAWRLLNNDGILSVVVPFDYRRRMEDEATFQGFFPSCVCAVRTVYGKPARRFLLSFHKHPCERIYQSLTLGDDDYKLLTQDFYL